jgi:uncharacterized membrane protein YhaH (DUF805 family)
MDWNWYLFSFRGRINRGKMWLAVLVIMCWMMFLAFVTVATGIVSDGRLSFDIEDLFHVIDPASYRSLSWAGLPTLLIRIMGSALFVWVYFAASVKRLHDRDRSGWWMIPFFVGPGIFDQFSDRLGDSYFLMVPAVIVFGFVIWGFIEMYCLKGSRKTNRFGASPLQPIDTRPRWEQQSEVEMVPHKAGPPPVWRVKSGHD